MWTRPNASRVNNPWTTAAYHPALFAVWISRYRLRWIQSYSELGEEVLGERITVDQSELARVDGQVVTDVEVFHRVVLTVGAAGPLYAVATNDRAYVQRHRTTCFTCFTAKIQHLRRQDVTLPYLRRCTCLEQSARSCHFRTFRSSLPVPA